MISIDKSKVARVYSGSVGCMCGCKGNYSDSGRSVSIIVNKLQADPNTEYDAVARCYHVITAQKRQLAAYMR